MATVSEQLRFGRESLGLTVHEVAEITKIKTEHVRALEAGDYQAFAAPVYIRGFVRTYARLVRLDPEAMVAAVDAELRQTASFDEPQSMTPANRGFLDAVMLQLSKVNWRIAIPLLGLAVVLIGVILGYRAYVGYRSRDPLANLGSGQHAAPQINPAEMLPLPSGTNR